MAEDSSREPEAQKKVQRSEPSAPGLEGALEAQGVPAYPTSLLGDPRLSGRGNGPVRVAVMRQAQRTYGNKAVQRFLQRSKAEAAREGEGLEEKGSAQPQADTDNAVVGDPVVAQRMSSLDNVEEGLDVNADMGEKAGAEADGGSDVAMPSAPGRTPSPALALRDSLRATPIALSVQRDIKDEKDLANGKFKIDFTTKDATKAGERAQEMGTITYTPNAKAPESGSIRFVQIVRDFDTGTGKDYVWTEGEAPRNKQFTTEDKAKGVQPGYFVDQSASTHSPRTKKTDAHVLPYYDAHFPGPGTNPGLRKGKQVVPASLWDGPGSAGTRKFDFETSAKAEDTGTWYGTVLWGFEIYDDKGLAKIKNEYKDFKEARSATTDAALKTFDEHYGNPGASTAPTK